LRNAFSGGVSTFNCVVYFVRKAHSLEILWGTSSPIQVFDRFLNAQVDLKGRGAYKVQIANPNVFLTKLLGNNIQLLTPDELENYFSNEFQEIIKSCIAEILGNSEQSLLGVDSRIRALSKEITPELSEVLDGYGLSLITFSISGLDVDPVIKERYNEASMSRLDKRFEALGDEERMDILGDDRWKLQQTKNILGDLANNPGAGGVAAAGAGLGMGMGAGGAFAAMAQNMFTPSQSQSTAPLPKSTSRFTPKSSDTPVSPAPSTPSDSADDLVATLKKLKDMLDLGLISQDIYNTKQAEILSRM
jgi:membrane protease subunit (stomatin/prohibitin family)